MLAGVPLAFAFALGLDVGTDPLPGGVLRSNAQAGIRRPSGPLEPRYGMFTASVFWRRDSVLKSGTAQFKPISLSRG
ncbi:hypothetical protein AL036_21295, partial [Salipiger aestuarii]